MRMVGSMPSGNQKKGERYNNVVYSLDVGAGIDDVEQTCFECGRKCVNRRSLGNHVARSHKDLGHLKGYVIKHLLDGNTPLCKCGCSENVEWHNVRYKFNDYVNGHNDAGGFTRNGYKQTPEQIAHRNDMIRKAYAERGAEISVKISESVMNAFMDVEKKQCLINGHVRGWQNPERIAKFHMSQLVSWQGEAGKIRRSTVFTKEFGRKISLANMRRKLNRSSKKETAFLGSIIRVFPDAVGSKYFNFTERTWCADVWLPTQRAIVEFDGMFYHGIGKHSDFSLIQITNIANDILKNKLAIDHKLTLLRIAEGTDVSRIESFDDLVTLAYHVVIDGVVVKEATLRLDENAPIVSRETLLRINDKERVRKLYLPAIVSLLRAHVAYHGWFYPPTERILKDALSSISDVRTLGSDLTSSMWLKSFIKSYWDVDDGPMQTFFNDKTLSRVLSYRLGLNNSKPYTYRLSDGTRITSNETFDVNFHNIRRGFIVQRKAVSWFNPSYAAFIYKKFIGDVSEPVVWDPSIGFSARMLGFAATFDRGMYIGTDPSKRMYADADRVKHAIRELKPNVEFELNNVGSEFYPIEPDSLDFVFTSPPYFDVEKYFDEPGQCWRDHPTFDDWINGYLVPTFEAASMGLKRGKLCVFNVSAELVNTVIDAAQSVGFDHCSNLDIDVNIRRDHFSRKNDSAQVVERFVVLCKHSKNTEFVTIDD